MISFLAALRQVGAARRASRRVAAGADRAHRRTASPLHRWLLSLTLLCFGAFAQPPTEADLPASQAAAIAAARKTLEQRRDLGASERQQAEDLLREAEADDKRADELAEQWRQMRQTAEGAEAAAKKLEEALARDNTPALLAWRNALPEHATVEQLEALLGNERAALAAARSAAVGLAGEIERQSARPAELRDELAAAYAALDHARTSPPAATSRAPLAQAQAQALRARAAERLAAVRVALLELENRSYEPRQRLLAAQLHDRQRLVAELEQHVAVLETRVLERTGADVAQFCARAAPDADGADAVRLLREAAERNRALCEQLTHVVARMGELRREKQALDGARQDTELALANTEERIRIGGISEAVGLILLAEQRKLKPLPQLRRELEALQAELARTRMDAIDVREQQNALADLQAEADALTPAAAGVAPEALATLRGELLRRYNLRGEILPRLATQQARLISALGDTEQELRDLIAATGRLGTMLETHLLWTPSHTPVGPAWLARLPHDAAAFLAAHRGGATLAHAARALAERPLSSAAGALLLVLLVLLARRAPARLQQITVPMRRIRSDRYRLTGAALGWTLLRAAPLPVALWSFGKLVQAGAAYAHGETEDVSAAWLALVVPTAALCFLRALTTEHGLAQFHFRWPRPRRQSLHFATLPLALLLLPCLFLLDLLGGSAPLDTLGRLLLAAALAGAGALAWWLLAPGRLWTARHTVVVEPSRLRQASRLAAAGLCVLLALLDLRGYFVTAQALSAHVLRALGLLLILTTLHGLAVRWLVLGERRLAFKRMLEKQSAEETGERGEGAPAAERIEAEAMSLASIGTQTRRLLRALTVVATGAALLWVFADVAPALSMLGNVTVWDSSQLVDGKETALHVSLRDVLEAAVLLLLTWVATRNLPGLLEVGVLRRFPVDAPTRYAITSLTRYLIVFAGTIVDWDNKEVVVPNKSFITDRLINWTLSDTTTRVVIKVGVAYRNDPAAVRRLLLEIAAAHPLVLAEPAPSCWLTGFGDNSQDFELRVYVAEIEQRNPVRTELHCRIAEAFRAHDIEIPFPQRDVWLRNADALQPAPSAAATNASNRT